MGFFFNGSVLFHCIYIFLYTILLACRVLNTSPMKVWSRGEPATEWESVCELGAQIVEVIEGEGSPAAQVWT